MSKTVEDDSIILDKSEVIQFPKISIVTPSYNQGQFIEDTILSVINQNYPNLEYIIIDGGSTDNSVEIIKKHEPHLFYWVSEKDFGQSHAINKGFEKSTGDILLWLNSDDMLMPNVLNKMAVEAKQKNLAGIFFGNCIHFSYTQNGVEAIGSNVVEKHASYSLKLIDYIIQPSSFWTRMVWDAVGKLREDLHYGFDWEWFLRAAKKNIPFYALPTCFSIYRIHESHKTGTGGKKRQEELYNIYLEYSLENAGLYKKIIEDNSNLSFWLKIKSRLLNILFRNDGFGEFFKKLRPKKYKQYTAEQIELCSKML